MRRYGKCVVIFDGYDIDPPTKDHEHQRRSLKSIGAKEVKVLPDNKVDISQSAFLSNDRNKVQLIDLLKRAFESDGHTIKKQ